MDYIIYVDNFQTVAVPDGATIRLSGPTNRTLLSDATGFFGAVDLPLGDYTMTASFTNLLSKSAQVTIGAGAVAAQDFTLDAPPGVAFFRDVSATPGAREGVLTWTTDAEDSSDENRGRERITR